MHFSSAPSATSQEMVRAIMAEKNLDKIIRKTTMETMNIIKEQMARMVATVKTTVWGGKHRSLSLVLKKYDYRTVTRDSSATIDCLSNPAQVNESITAFSIPF